MLLTIRTAAFPTLLALFVVGAVEIGGARSTPQEPDRAPVRVRELLTQRRSVLFQIERIQTERYAAGVVGAEEMMQASIDRLRGELELTTDRAGRIELLEAQVELARALEARVTAAADAGRTTEIEVLRAASFRLGTEVELARLR